MFIAIGKTLHAYGMWQEMKMTLKNPTSLGPTFPFDNGPLEAFTLGGFNSFVPPSVESLTLGIVGSEVKY